MAWEHDLANEIKKRNNEFKIGAVVGDVVESNDNYYKIFILNKKVLIDNSNSYKTYGLTFKDGDKVLVIATENNQLYFIVNRLE